MNISSLAFLLFKSCQLHLIKVTSVCAVVSARSFSLGALINVFHCWLWGDYYYILHCDIHYKWDNGECHLWLCLDFRENFDTLRLGCLLSKHRALCLSLSVLPLRISNFRVWRKPLLHIFTCSQNIFRLLEVLMIPFQQCYCFVRFLKSPLWLKISSSTYHNTSNTFEIKTLNKYLKWIFF